MFAHYITSPLANIPCVANWIEQRGPFIQAVSIPVDQNNYPIPGKIQPLFLPSVNHPKYAYLANFSTQHSTPPLLIIPTCGKVIIPPENGNHLSYPGYIDYGIEILTKELGGTPITITNKDHIIGTFAVHSFIVDLLNQQTYWIQEIDGLISNGLVQLTVRSEEGKMRKFLVPPHRMILPWDWRWARLRKWYQGKGYLDDPTGSWRLPNTFSTPSFSSSTKTDLSV